MIAEFHVIPKNRFEVEVTLKKYWTLKSQIELIEKDIAEDIYAPSAASTEMGSMLVIRTVKEPIKNAKGQFEKTKKGNIRFKRKREAVKEDVPIFARSEGTTSDPTFQKSQKIIAYKRRIEKDLAIMKYKVKVIDDELDKLNEKQKFGTARQKQDASSKLKIVNELMSNCLSDTGIWSKLSIPERTYYKWKNELIASMLERFKNYKNHAVFVQ